MTETQSLNDTNRLLQAILDQQSGYNWNPITFAFTAAIGALALVVAMVTVFQGLLAAGPGRLKASGIAMGPLYSKTAKTNLDSWTVSLIVKAAQDREGNKHTIEDPGISIPLSTESASWMNLIRDIGLMNFEFEPVPCRTDYLGSELIAPPAYADIQSICIFAAIAGCDVIKPNPSNNPDDPLIIRGMGSQVTFGKTLGLGMTASYNRLMTMMPYHSGNYMLDFLHSVSEGIGGFQFGLSKTIGLLGHTLHLGHAGIIIDALKVRSGGGDCGHAACIAEAPQGHFPGEVELLLLAADPPCARVIPVTKLGIHEALARVAAPYIFSMPSSQSLATSPGSDMLVEAIRELGTVRVLSEKVFKEHLFLGDRLELMRTKDVRERVNSFPAVIRDALSSSMIISSTVSWAHGATDGNEALSLRPIKRPHWHEVSGLHDTDLVLVQAAFDACVGWGSNSDYLYGMEAEQRAFTRTCLQFQLQEVDWWLWKNGGRAAACEALAVMDRVLSGRELSSPDSQCHSRGIHSLLVYRAALFATLCATGADNSPAAETDLGRQIVRIL